jgi:hypothetical protein
MIVEVSHSWSPDERERAELDALVGKTITAVLTPKTWDQDELVLEFSDGTRVGLNACGYETDGIAVEVSKP